MAFSTKFYTTKFEFSHGKKPKGWGGWAFIVMDGDTEHETVFVPGAMTLANAKTWMRTYCRTNYSDVPAGFVEVEVAP